jgi:beta-lactam-binding protein with PASTA domain
MVHSKSRFIKLYLTSARLMTGASLLLLSYSSTVSAGANQALPNEVRLAQAQAQTQLTVDQLPTSRLSNSAKLEYGDRINGTLNVSSIRHQGRRFAIYQFEGEAEQSIRINLVGGLASDRTPGQLQTGALLINPVVVLLNPAGEIIAQQPEQTDVANALIRMNLPTTGTYNILVTSATVGAGGRYTLTLQQLEPGQ